jgi:zinc transport system substrate-binding protein
MIPLRLPLAFAALAALSIVLGACGGDDTSTKATAAEPLRVTAGFYPLYEAAAAIGGDQAKVTNLTPTGSGPHDLELTPQAAAKVSDADLVLYLGAGFQPSVEKAASQAGGSAVDLLDGVDLRAADDGIPGVQGEVDGERLEGDKDPHVWVDPALFVQLSQQMEDAFVAADPEREETWRANGERYRRRLSGLDEEFASGLKDCKTRTLVTSHAAFGYLTDRYDLKQAPIAGISPDDEPDPQSVAAVAELAKRDGVKTVFFETLVPPDLSETVAEEIGAKTDALDPVEGLDEDGEAAGKTYGSIQRDNLQRIAKGLGCTTA